MGKFVPGKSGNPTGRPPNSTNRVPSNAEIKKSIKKGSVKALNKLISLLDDTSSDIQLKSAVKILDVAYEILQEEDKAKGAKTLGNPAGYSVEKKEDRKVMSIRSKKG